MSNQRRKLVLSGAALVVLVLASCGAPMAETATPTAPSTPEPIAVRVFPDASGDYATFGAAAQDVPAGSRILLSASTYRLDAPLNIGKALSLPGAAMDQTEIVSRGEGYPVRVSGEGP